MKNLFKKIGAFFVSLTKQKSIIITGVISAIFGIIMIYSPFGKIGSHERHFRDLMEHLWEAVMFASFCEIPASFLTDKLKAWKKYLIQLAVGVVSAGGMFLVLHFVKEQSYADMYFLGAIFVLVCFTAYILVPKESCSSYYANIFSHMLFSFMLVFVSFLGMMLLCFAYDNLIHKLEDFDNLIEVIAVICFQLFFTVIYSYHLLEKRTEPSSKLFKVVFLYIVLPVYLVLIGLLYAYLIKALFIWELPQGQINWFVSFATAIYLVFYFILQEYREEKVISVFYRFGGLILIPLIMVQIPTYFIRVNAYGFTGWRYTSLLYNIFATVCVIFTFIKKGKFVKYAIPVLGILGVIAAFTPFNLINVAYNSQYGRMVKVLTKYGMLENDKLTDYNGDEIDKKITEEEREALYGAFIYIRSTSEHKKPDWFDKNKYAFNDMFRIGAKGEIKEILGHLDVKENITSINISGYSSMKRDSINFYGYNYETKKEVYKEPVLYGLSLKDYLLNHDDSENPKPLYIEINDRLTIVIFSFRYTYNIEVENFYSYSIHYYELRK